MRTAATSAGGGKRRGSPTTRPSSAANGLADILRAHALHSIRPFIEVNRPEHGKRTTSLVRENRTGTNGVGAHRAQFVRQPVSDDALHAASAQVGQLGR